MSVASAAATWALAPGDVVPRALGLAAASAPGLAWLDGGDAARGFLGVEPDLEIESDELAALAEVEARWRAQPDRVWIGWLTYELGARALLGRAPPRGRLPGLCMRRYPAALELGGGGPLRFHGDEAAIARLRRRLAAARPIAPASWPFGRLAPVLTIADYRRRLAAVLEAIRAGDTYQVNLSHVLRASWREAPRSPAALAGAVASAYASVRARAPASMGALVDAGPAWILSNSPETLVDVRLGASSGEGELARAWPIKGTRPRAGDPEEDRRRARELLESPKDRAEHLMIVDLLRNDLGRLARPGSVRAPRVPELVALPTVHHLVSEVRCALAPGWTLASLVAALFPGGSITGAPKRRTVELIDAIEEHERGLYCGALLVLEPGGLRASIPIRTAIVDHGGLSLCSGGGVVADSDPDDEWRETLVKARAFDPAAI